MILGVLWNDAIWNDCPWLCVGCGKILDLGIFWIICLEIIFLMIITSEPINVIDKHTAKKYCLSWNNQESNVSFQVDFKYKTKKCTYGQGILL